jgi:biotin synthase-like enzyme
VRSNKCNLHRYGKGQFERVLEMTGKVRDMGMEVCATLGGGLYKLQAADPQRVKAPGFNPCAIK